MRPIAPAERVRARLRAAYGDQVADRLPSGYQRLGSVLLLRLPEGIEPALGLLGRLWCEELGVRTVLARVGPVEGEHRRPNLRLLAGETGETEVVEGGVHYRFDAQRILFARGNSRERRRFGGLVRPGETVADLFAGIGYFTLPALAIGRAGRVHAVEKNPLAFGYLEENVRRIASGDRASLHRGDNREVDLPVGAFDRVVLGFLPSSLPWVPRALDLLRPEGGWLHLHLLAGTTAGVPGAAAEARRAIERNGGCIEALEAREVKPYGPGRLHAVVDASVRPPAAPPR